MADTDTAMQREMKGGREGAGEQAGRQGEKSDERRRKEWDGKEGGGTEAEKTWKGRVRATEEVRRGQAELWKHENEKAERGRGRRTRREAGKVDWAARVADRQRDAGAVWMRALWTQMRGVGLSHWLKQAQWQMRILLPGSSLSSY